jgi:hypothetical protein
MIATKMKKMTGAGEQYKDDVHLFTRHSFKTNPLEVLRLFCYY